MLDKLAICGAVAVGLLMVFVGLNHGAYLTSWKGVALYLGAPGSVLATICTSFLLSREWRKTFFISGLSVVAGAYLFESWLWYDSYFDQFEPDADRRSQIQVVQEYRMKGTPAYPSVTPTMISAREPSKVLHTRNGRLFPLGGIANVMTIQCNESGQWRAYTSDEFGFANPPGLWHLSKIDVMAVGDSFTQGACVPFGDSFVAGIRKRFPLTLGLGAGGNGPLAELASIREYVTIIRPRFVVWFYFENDLQQDIFSEKLHPLLARYLDPGFKQGLFHRQLEIDKGIIEFVKLLHPESSKSDPKPQLRKFKLGDLFDFSDRVNPLARVPALTLALTRRSLGLNFGGGEWPEPDTETFRKVLRIARDEVAVWDGQLFLVQLPSWDAIVLGDRRKDHFYNAAHKVAKELDITVIDLAPVFREHRDPRSLWPNGKAGHYGEAGHKLVARIVNKALLAAERR